MSHNPFRKARDAQEDIKPSEESIAAGLFKVGSPQQEAPPKAKSTKKKVVFQTPPRSPEEPLRRLSLGRPPSPIPQQDGITLNQYAYPQGGYTPTDSSLEQAFANVRSDSTGTSVPATPVTSGGVEAPYNPFAKTLESSESKYGARVQKPQESNEAEARTKRAFDVDMFKNILLNGAAPPAIVRKGAAEPERSANALSSHARAEFEGRFPSLDSTQMIQSPAVIEDGSSSDEEVPMHGREVRNALEDRQTLSFDDFDSIMPPSAELPITSGLDHRSKTSTDFDKPLPSPPTEQYRTSISDGPATKVVAPPPPATRRQAQNNSSPSRRRSSSVMSKSSIQSDTSSTVQQPASSEGAARAPPPPPSRRANLSRSSTMVSPADEPLASPAHEKQNVPPPAPAPRRAPTKPAYVEKRPTSSNSKSTLQPLSETSSFNATPPRPPPRRALGSNRSSVDGPTTARRSSGQDSRRVSNDLESSAQTETNILSDLAALQREVDDLVAKAATD